MADFEIPLADIPVDMYDDQLPNMARLLQVTRENERPIDQIGQRSARGELTRAIGSVLAVALGYPMTSQEIVTYAFPTETAHYNRMRDSQREGAAEKASKNMERLRGSIARNLGGLTVPEYLEKEGLGYQNGLVRKADNPKATGLYVHRAIPLISDYQVGLRRINGRVVLWNPPRQVYSQ